MPNALDLDSILDSGRKQWAIIKQLSGEGALEQADADALISEITSACENGPIEPEIVELSVVDPDDPERRRVIAPVMLRSADAEIQGTTLMAYREEMRSNLRVHKPIVPHLGLYSRMVWLFPVAPGDGTMRKQIIPERQSHWDAAILAYDLGTAEEPGNVGENIQAFATRFYPRLPQRNRDNINCLAVFPMFSPVRRGSSHRGDIRGGALFIWGRNDAAADHAWSRVVLNIRELLHNTVLTYSATRAEVRATLSLQGLVAHHLKNLFPPIDALDVASDLRKLGTKLQEVVWRLPPEGKRSDSDAFVEQRVGDVIEVLAELQSSIPAHMYRADEFRALFDLLAQSSDDVPGTRLTGVFRSTQARLIDVLRTTMTVTSKVKVITKPELSGIPDGVRLPGPKLIYDIIMRELIKNAERHHAQQVVIRFLGFEWSAAQDLLGDFFWIELSDDGDGIAENPSEGGKSQSTGIGVKLIKRFLNEYLSSVLQGPLAAEGGHGAVFRLRLPSSRLEGGNI